MNPLIVLIPYFGKWPSWINLFVESCRWNPDIRWRLFTDCGPFENRADNVEVVETSFDEYKARVRSALRVDFDPQQPYKLCDVRPALGKIHERETRDFAFFGFGDLDVIYGNLRAFYTDELLAKSRVLSTHPERLSGHFAVLRNDEDNRRAFERLPGFRDALAKPDYVGVDERLHEVWRGPPEKSVLDRVRSKLTRPPEGLVFVERYSTVLGGRGWHDGGVAYPKVWFWREGRLSNDQDGDRQFMYLHFMRWHSRRWAELPPIEGEGAWESLPSVVRVDWRDAAIHGFSISREGFLPLATPVLGT